MTFATALAMIATGMAGLQPAQDAPPAPQAKAADAEKTFCRRETETGSRFTKKVCHTKAEWAQIDRDNSGAATDAMRRNRTGAQ